jgi:hypothetical protein
MFVLLVCGLWAAIGATFFTRILVVAPDFGDQQVGFGAVRLVAVAAVLSI